MENTSIGNYLIEEIGNKNYHLFHNERKDYIREADGQPVAFKEVGKYSDRTGTFVGVKVEGKSVLIDDNGICRFVDHFANNTLVHEVFEYIGEEGMDKFHSRPVKRDEEGGYWTYCTYIDGKMVVEDHDYCSRKENGDNARLGIRLGSRGYYCIEITPISGEYYKRLFFRTSEDLNVPVSNHRFKGFAIKRNCICGRDFSNTLVVFPPRYDKKTIATFKYRPVNSEDVRFWGGLYKKEWVIYDFKESTKYKKPYTPYEQLEYNESLQVFIFRIKSVITDIWDMTSCAESIMTGQFYWMESSEHEGVFHAIDYKGDTYDLSLEEYVGKHRDFIQYLYQKVTTKVAYKQKNLNKLRDDEVRLLGFNALAEFVKQVSFSDWKVWYFKPTYFNQLEKIKIIVLTVTDSKIENPSLVLVEHSGTLYVCSRMKEDIGNHIYYLSILFEIKDIPPSLFQNVASGTRMEIQDIISFVQKEKPSQVIPAEKAIKEKEKSTTISLLEEMHLLCDKDKEQSFSETNVEFDGIKYSLIPHEPWTIEENPFYRKHFLNKANGVFVLLDDSFINEPMKGTETPFGVPDYAINGEGFDGYISNANANGAIIRKHKDVYLFYRTEKCKNNFFDRATYWGHYLNGETLKIYLKSVQRREK